MTLNPVLAGAFAIPGVLLAAILLLAWGRRQARKARERHELAARAAAKLWLQERAAASAPPRVEERLVRLRPVAVPHAQPLRRDEDGLFSISTPDCSSAIGVADSATSTEVSAASEPSWSGEGGDFSGGGASGSY